MVEEAHRVLRPGGRAVFMVYNRVSWLNAMSKLMKVPLEHEDAPVLRMYSIDEFRGLLARFRQVTIVPERFPVKSRLHRGAKAYLYNTLFVGLFNAVPRAAGAAIRLAPDGVLREVTPVDSARCTGLRSRSGPRAATSS